jgi:hypothetical protein
MNASIPHLNKLLERLAETTGQSMTIKGLKEMSERVGLTERYLADYIYRKKEAAKEDGKMTISVQVSKLDEVAKYLKYSSYQDFVDKMERPVEPVLLSLVGNYYSYVRRNDEQGYILRSPVRIYESRAKILFELKGPMRLYQGEIKLRQGCLFILMEEEAGKQIHHVYKIGTRPKPQVLQGIFSGVSTNFDPIGGRTVLVQSDNSFDKLQHKEGSVKEFSKSDQPAEKSISNYLKDYSSNNLRINRVVGFGDTDLNE